MQHPDPIAEFLDRLKTSLADGTFVRLLLSGPLTGDHDLERVLVRRIHLRTGPHLALTMKHRRRDVARNLPEDQGVTWLADQLAGAWKSALLGTTQRDWQLHFPRRGQPQLSTHKPVATTAPRSTHDRERVRVLDATARDWLHGLGVMDAQGKVLPSMADKHRQINRYLEILSHLLDDCGWQPGQPLALTDMGCGKGYLTFAAWHWLHRLKHSPVTITGVEARPDLVEKTRALAAQLPAAGLAFVAGTIDHAPLAAVDVLVALHACDTATDDAILRGVRAGARLIVVAPCCQREVRPQLQHPPVLAPVLRHGVMEERLAEWVTDGLRALYLEWAGYQTKVFEFVSAEHTAKNLMIAAVRGDAPFARPGARERVEELKRFFGIKRHHLDPLLTPPPA